MPRVVIPAARTELLTRGPGPGALPPLQRGLAINAIVSCSAAMVTMLCAMTIDQQSPGILGQIAAIAVLQASCAGAFVPFAKPGARFRTPALYGACAAILCAPMLVPGQAPAMRFVAALCSLVLVMKCIDLHVGSRRRAADPRTALLFLFTSLLVLRNVRAPVVPQEAIAKAVLETLAGVAAVGLVLQVEWAPWPFLVEHSAKTFAIALMVFPATNLLMAVTRKLGGPARDYSVNSIRARTPAEFWRRYNRVVGEFLYEDVARPIAGDHAPARAVLVAFAVSALLHEYLLAAAVGRVLGYQTAFFALQALAVLATMRLRPRGLAAAVGTTCTVAFMLLTTAVFGANIQRAFAIYANPLPRWLIW